MNSDRTMALVMLDLISGSSGDEGLAAKLESYEDLAAGSAYLAGFVIEALALQRREPLLATVQFLRQAIGDGDDDGLGGVREPLRPRPSPGGAAATVAGE